MKTTKTILKIAPLMLLLATVISGCGGAIQGPSSNQATISSSLVAMSSSSAAMMSSSSVMESSSAVAISSSVIASSSPAFLSSSSAEAASSSSVATIPAGAALVYAINAGGAKTTLGGIEYQADRFSTGTGGTTTTQNPISDTTEDTLYQSQRYGTNKYEIPVTNSTYSVKLHFAEIYHKTAGARLFSVSVEGQPIIQNIDLYKDVGQEKAYDVIVPMIMVADKSLTIELTSQIDNATISGFSIYSNDGGTFVEPPDLGPGTEGDGDIVVGPTYKDSPDLNDANVPKGKIYQFTMKSSDSAIFTGFDSTLTNTRSFTRTVRVYVPQQYVNGTKAPFIVSQDGLNGNLPKALNVLIARKTVQPIVVVGVDNGGGDSLGSQRGLEYDTMSDRYSRFITTEVLPSVEKLAAIKADYPNFALTKDPDGRGTYGCSSGGAAAFTMGWFTPDQFRRIITYSGTFVDQQDTDAAEERMYPWGAYEYPAHLIAQTPAKPLRVFLHVSQFDNDNAKPDSSHHNWVTANKLMAAEFAKKNYHYRFVYAQNAGHCDGKVINQTLPETVSWMWKDYKPKD
jgi:enterochelin esterase-like enzyme